MREEFNQGSTSGWRDGAMAAVSRVTQGTDLLGEQVTAEFGVLPYHKIWFELRCDSQQVLGRLQAHLTGEQPAEQLAGHRLGHDLRQPEPAGGLGIGGPLHRGHHRRQRQVR